MDFSFPLPLNKVLQTHVSVNKPNQPIRIKQTKLLEVLSQILSLAAHITHNGSTILSVHRKRIARIVYKRRRKRVGRGIGNESPGPSLFSNL